MDPVTDTFPDNAISDTPASTGRSFVRKRPVLVMSVALAIVTAAVCCRVVGNGFILYDDDVYVTDNAAVLHGLAPASVRWAFWNDGFHAGNWHPLTWLSHMLDVQLFGRWAAGHHLTSLLLHLCNTLMLFGFLRYATRALWPSIFVAALFALHPMHVESFAWVAERKDVLSTFLFLAAAWTYVLYTRKPCPRHYVAVIALFILGLMSKPMLVSLPFVLLLLDYWPLSRFAPRIEVVRKLIAEKIPLFLLAAASAAITLNAQGRAVERLDALDLTSRLVNAATSYGWYIWKTVWPLDLSVFYPYPQNPSRLLAVVIAILLIAITIAAFRLARHRGYLLAGWLWYLVTLLPVIGIVQVGSQAHADRYTYIPYIGLFLAICWAAADIMTHRPAMRRPIAIAASAVLLLLGILTWRETGFWKDSVTLFGRSVAVTRDNYVMTANLGMALAAQGDIDGALVQLKESLRVRPNACRTLDAMGTLLAQQGKYREALDEYLRAIDADPEQYSPQYNAGVTLLRLGQAAEAIPYCRRALELRPGWPEAYMQLGVASAAVGDDAAAGRVLEQAVELKPELWKAHIQLADIYIKQARWDAAAQQYRKALLLKTDYDTLNNLASALVQAGKDEEAESLYRKAIAIKPDAASAYVNLAVVLARKGNPLEATDLLEKAVRLEPDNQQAKKYLNMLRSGR
jgi:protein O-mannosyl-transferase